MKYIKSFEELNESNANCIDYLKKKAVDIANILRCDIHGSCVHFTEVYLDSIVEDGNMYCLNYITVVEGWVDCELGEGIPQAHTWIEIMGEKIDPTFIQFGHDAEYSNERSTFYNGLDYYKKGQEGSWFRDRRKEFPDYVYKPEYLKR